MEGCDSREDHDVHDIPSDSDEMVEIQVND